MKKLWPTLQLLVQHEKSEKLVQEVFENDDSLNTDLYETIAKLYFIESERLTKQDVNDWVNGNKEENFQLMTNDEILQGILHDNEVEHEEFIVRKFRTVQHSIVITSINTCLQWVDESDVKFEAVEGTDGE